MENTQPPVPSEQKVDAPAPVENQPKTESKPEDKSSVGSGFAVLSKKEKAFREKVAAEKAALARERAEVEALRKEAESWKSKDALKKTKPLEWLKEHGLSYEQLTEVQLAGGEPTPSLLVDEVKGEVADLRKAIAEEKRQALEAEQSRLKAETDRVLEAFGKQCEQFIGQNAEKYEYTHLFGQAALVRQVVEEHYNVHKKVLSIPEASDIVEAYLEKEAEKLTASKKFKAKVGAPVLPPKAPPEKSAVEAQPRTLSNLMAGSTTVRIGRNEDDREARALKALLDANR